MNKLSRANTATANAELATQSSKAQVLMTNVSKALVGQKVPIKLAVTALVAGGHVLIEDVPGVGKTLLAKSLATSIRAGFKRVQATPDLLPSDISGVNIFEQKDSAFRFVPGPIFTNILLVDEINRATPRTQSSLLEAMEEQQVTVDGVTHRLPELFFVLATENPIEHQGTFPLPEAQLDRFMISMSVGYPERDHEKEIVRMALTKGSMKLDPVLTLEDIMACRQALDGIFLHETLVDYIVDIVDATRQNPATILGVSPRGGQLLARAARAAAFVEGRDFVIPEDIKFLAPYVFGHRIVPKVKSKRVSHAEIIAKIVEAVPISQ